MLYFIETSICDIKKEFIEWWCKSISGSKFLEKINNLEIENLRY
jgi:hypothetical protein